MSNLPISLAFWRRKTLPILLQSESAECGLVCLAMISSYWGNHISISTIRQQFGISLRGINLRDLMSVSSALNLRPRALKLTLDHLQNLQVPCILHWDLTHFVVLKKVGRRSVWIHDPSLGMRKLSNRVVQQHFTGVALELTPTSEFRPTSDSPRVPLRVLMGRVIGLKSGLLQLLVLGLALQFCALIAPFYIQWVVDDAIISGDRHLIYVLGAGFLLLVLLQTCITCIRAWATTVLSTQLNIQWLSNTFSHLLRLPTTYFERRHTGDVVSRFSSIDTMQRSLTSQLVQSLIDGVLVIGTLIMMLIYNAHLAIVATVAVFLFGSTRWFLFRSMRDATAEQIIYEARQSTHFLETIRGIQSIKIYGGEATRLNTWLSAVSIQFNAALKVARLAVMGQSANTIIFGTERVLVIGLAALLVVEGNFSVGMLMAFLSYKDQFSQRTSALIENVFELRMLRLHADRLSDILLTAKEENTGPALPHPPNIDKIHVQLKNVSYQYSTLEPPVIQHLSLCILPGECVAITGASGCGKTTLVKILLGLFSPTQGELLINGVPVSKIGISTYRLNVGAVLQDDVLFSGTIAENISFFDSAQDQDKIIQCAKQSAIHDDIIAMPMGYSTFVGDIGSGLSGGQKQRVLLARALYRQPKLLILDEATSHLDLRNEKLVNDAIRKLPLTRIIIAHRPETISMADRVIVLDQKYVHDSKGEIRHMPHPCTQFEGKTPKNDESEAL